MDAQWSEAWQTFRYMNRFKDDLNCPPAQNMLYRQNWQDVKDVMAPINEALRLKLLHFAADRGTNQLVTALENFTDKDDHSSVIALSNAFYGFQWRARKAAFGTR